MRGHRPGRAATRSRALRIQLLTDLIADGVEPECRAMQEGIDLGNLAAGRVKNAGRDLSQGVLLRQKIECPLFPPSLPSCQDSARPWPRRLHRKTALSPVDPAPYKEVCPTARSRSGRDGPLTPRYGAHHGTRTRRRYHRPSRLRWPRRPAHDADLHPIPRPPQQIAGVRFAVLNLLASKVWSIVSACRNW